MTRPLLSAAVLFVSLALVACGPKGDTTAEKRKVVRDMRSKTLTELYRIRPGAQARLRQAVGYGVFSNIETKIMFVGGGSGYGVVVDNGSGRETFMRMAKLQGGVGMGIQDFRAVFVFNDRDTMRQFVEEGWQFGGGADASLKAGEKGAAMSGEVAADTDVTPMEIYQFTESGVALSATAAGTKYWKDTELN